MIGFMRKLIKDHRGSTAVIVAAAMIPMMGVIGCGVDMSRTYLAKTRLQQACDAGVLGGRKVMGASGVDSTVTSEVKKYVDYDFPQGTLGTASFPITPTAGPNNSVNLTLSTSVPTVIMKVFGTNTVAISATCTARQDFVNTDIVLVLDTTLSMNCLPSESGSTYCPSEKSGSKIQALRSAVTAFYNSLKPAQDELEANGLRLRYGIVPFSETVNVGNLLRSTDASWVNDTWSYRKCTNPSPHTSFTTACSASTLVSIGPRAPAFWGTWNGCIEERQTLNNITSSSGYTPPSGAYDLDVNLIPSSPSSRWNVYDTVNETARAGLAAGLDSACPKAVQQIQAVSSVSTINSYTASTTASGYTYLDLGMLWGARLLSQTGLWASNNPSSYNSFPVNRHLILFTDGNQDSDTDAYTAYGVEKFDKRVTGTGNATTQQDSHEQRFRMLCNSVKGMNVNVWVVSFGAGSTLNTDLVNCASTPSQAFKADDQAALIAKFTEIGQAIGALRLSQ